MVDSVRVPWAPRGCYWCVSLLLAWLLMQGVHEGGHVAGAWLTGGEVRKVVLHPWTISRTDVSPNPAPIWVIWAGPIGGVIAPLIVWGLVRWYSAAAAVWWQFFAGFCLIANGCYLGSGSIEPIGDAEELVRLGNPWWQLLGFGLITVPAGLAMWHGLGPEFGLGPDARAIAWRRVALKVVVLAGIVLVELLASDSG